MRAFIDFVTTSFYGFCLGLAIAISILLGAEIYLQNHKIWIHVTPISYDDVELTIKASEINPCAGGCTYTLPESEWENVQ